VSNREVFEGVDEFQQQLPNMYIPFEIAVHDGEEDLEEEIDSINEDSE